MFDCVDLLLGVIDWECYWLNGMYYWYLLFMFVVLFFVWMGNYWVKVILFVEYEFGRMLCIVFIVGLC